jgi:hypothetical protein
LTNANKTRTNFKREGNVFGLAKAKLGHVVMKVRARIAASLCAVAVAWIGTQRADAQSSSASRAEREMISWVVLSNTYVALDVGLLRAKLDEIYPGQFLPPRDKGNFVVNGPGFGQLFVNANMPGAAGMFLVISVPGPYTEFSDFQKKITDPSLRRQAEAQKCWLSVDMAHKNTTSEDAYRFIEQVLAKLAPADAAFLVHPSKLVTIPFDDDVRRRMASGSQAVSPQ